MATRIVRVFDGPAPSVEQIMFNDPDRPPFPTQVWASKMQENEIALFCIEAKTGLSVLEDGGRPTRLSDEYCRVSSDLSELRAHAKRIIEDHPTIVCILRAKDKSKVETIRKRRGTLSTLQLIAAFAGLIVCALAITVVGFAVLFSLRYAFESLVGGSKATLIPGGSSLHWMSYFAASFIIGASIMAVSMWVSVRYRVHRLHRKMQGALTPEELTMYGSINPLSVSPDINERRIAAQLSKKFFERMRGLNARKRD